MDKRNESSKEAIKKALVRLSKEKAYTDISIRELCMEAGVSRSTFYNNYKLFNDVIAEMSAEFMEKIKGRRLGWEFFDDIMKNSDEFKLLLEAGMFGREFCLYLKELITEDINAANKKKYGELSINTLTLYHAYGIFGVLLNLIENKDASYFNEMYSKCIESLMEVIENFSAE